jgi:transposase
MMDLRRFEESYATSGPGQAPFSPAMMLALLIYAYSNKVRSSRKIEQLCRRDAGFRLIVGDAVPDHTVIARFRRRHAADMEALFVEVLKLCREAGLLRLGVIALDGTKIKANAALDANRTARSLAEEVAAVFAEAEAVDAAEDVLSGERRGDVLPAALADAGSRKARLAACREKLAAKAAETAARQQQKIDARAGEERATGRSKRGRKPKPADDSVDPDGVANVTDPDSEIMKTRRGWVQGYNGQAVVTADQIIVAAELTAIVAAVVGEDVALGTVLADAGYWSEANAATETADCRLLIATQKDHRQRAALREAPPPRGRIPKTSTPRQRMDRRLRTKPGRALYRLRGQTVEPVFGHVKEQQGADRFMMRGLEACRGEWKLHAATHNLRKLHRKSILKTGNTAKRAIK